MFTTMFTSYRYTISSDTMELVDSLSESPSSETMDSEAKPTVLYSTDFSIANTNASSETMDSEAKPAVLHSTDSGIADTNDDDDDAISCEQFSTKATTENDQGATENKGATVAIEQEDATGSPARLLVGQKIEQKDTTSSRPSILEVQKIERSRVISRILPWRARSNELHIHAQEEQHEEVMENIQFVQGKFSFSPHKQREDRTSASVRLCDNHLIT